MLRPIPDYGYHMALADFIEECQPGRIFTNEDGSGYYATFLEMTDIPAIPSEIAKGNVLLEYTHVVWFNK